jgi:DNA-binding transcriptional regulator YhcF (GntR family)
MPFVAYPQLPMKIWLSKTSEVPFQEQLCTQLILGIVSADLVPGERLPSSNLVARRFHIHPNTVRSAYRELVRPGWADWRRGSGFFVRKSSPESALDAELDMDRLISAVFEIGRKKGYSVSDVQARMTRWLSLQPPDHVLAIGNLRPLRQVSGWSDVSQSGCYVDFWGDLLAGRGGFKRGIAAARKFHAGIVKPTQELPIRVWFFKLPLDF